MRGKEESLEVSATMSCFMFVCVCVSNLDMVILTLELNREVVEMEQIGMFSG